MSNLATLHHLPPGEGRGEGTPPLRPGYVWDVTETLRIGLPLAAAQLAQIGMGVTDTIFLGTLGPDALAAGSLAATAEFSLLIVLQGIIAAVSVTVSQARGAGRPSDIPRLYWTGLLLTLLLTIPAMLLASHAEPLLLLAGEPPALSHATARFLQLLQFSIPGALIGTGLQRAFLPAIDAGWIIFPITAAGTLLNIVLCYGFIHGTAGLPALGYRGPALATTIVVTLTALALTAFAHTGTRAKLSRWARPDLAVLASLARLGFPIGATYAVETGLFLAIALLLGRFGTDAVSAQQIALTAITVAFMIPVGLSQAANVRVGIATGAHDRAAARRAGLAAIALGAASEIAFAALNLLAPGLTVGLFLAPDTPAFTLATALLRLAALFQIADGIQSVAAGALRGLGDTRTPFALAAISYWAIGFPAAWALTLHTSLGPIGTWIGIAAGLLTAATLLTRRFLSRTAPI